MTKTCVPQVVQALYDMFTAARPATVDGRYVAISVGPPPGADIPDAYIAVGYGGEDRASVTGSVVEPAGANVGEFSAEDFEVWCTISTASGDQNGAAQMIVTQQIYDNLADALNADPTLSGVLKGESRAQVGSLEWIIDDGGAVATMFFTVLCRARWVT